MGWLDGDSISSRSKGIFSALQHPDQLWGAPSPLLIQYQSMLHSLGVKWLKQEADHSSLSIAGVKNGTAVLPFTILFYGIMLN
jgi:hypothetical protein